MRIAVLQFAPEMGKVDQNIRKAESLLAKVHGKTIDWLVLPELAFTGKYGACFLVLLCPRQPPSLYPYLYPPFMYPPYLIQ